MKKNLIIFTVILALIALIAGTILIITRENTTEKATLLIETGTVFTKLSSEADYIEVAETEIKFQTGMFIKTGAESYARIFLPDNSLVSLDENTEAQINFANLKIDIQQLIGKTWNRVQTVTNGGEFTVKTPNTIAAVRGTIFGVGIINKDHSRIFVEESEVEVNRFEDYSNPKVLETELIKSGDSAEVVKDEISFRIEKGETDSELRDSFWYKRNKILDEEWQKIKSNRNDDLLKRLKDALLKRSDYQEYKLEKNPNTESFSNIDKELDIVYKLSKISETSCKEHSIESIQSAINSISKYKDKIYDSNDILNLLQELKKICEDSEITPAEADILQTLVKNANE